MIDSLRRAIYHTLKAAWYWAFGEPGKATLEINFKNAVDRETAQFANIAALLPTEYRRSQAFANWYGEYQRLRERTPMHQDVFETCVFSAMAFGVEPTVAIRLFGEWLEAMGYEVHARKLGA